MNKANTLKMPWLRFIEGADPTSPMNSSGTGENQQEETPRVEEVDYKAKYEAMKVHSREWEAKAKENLSAAKRLKELEDAEKTELEKLEDKLVNAVKEREAANAELSRLRIASQHGISVEDAEMFLHGDAETMEKQAAALAKRVGKETPAEGGVVSDQLGAEDPEQGRGGQTDKRATAVAWAKSLFDKQ